MSGKRPNNDTSAAGTEYAHLASRSGVPEGLWFLLQPTPRTTLRFVLGYHHTPGGLYPNLSLVDGNTPHLSLSSSGS